jgi:hypothetical protein
MIGPTKGRKGYLTSTSKLMGPHKLLQLLVLPSPSTPTGTLWQQQGIIEWMHLGHSSSRLFASCYDLVARTISQGCLQCVQLVRKEPGSSKFTFSKEQHNWLWQFSEMWQNALTNFPGQLNKHFPISKLLHFASIHSFMFPCWLQENLILMSLLCSR